MSILILTHPSSHAHVTPPGHPERVARIEAVDRVLATARYATLPRAEAPAASDDQIGRAHDAAYVEMIKASAPAQGWVSLDPDTHMCPDSLEAACGLAGIMPRKTAPWVFACSTMSLSVPAMHWMRWASRSSPSSISMCITATEPRISSGPSPG
jgi:acetoin utilization deacetylase AcuC-like enzyme